MFSGEFVTEQFIYSATLLPPWMLYLYDKYIERGQQHDEEKRRKKFDQDPPGFFFIVGAAVFILVIAACCYGAEKQAQGSILFGTTTTQAHKPGLAMLLAAYVTYFYSLYCWYTLMLVSADPKQSEYVEKCREGEVDFSQEFGRKLREDNDGDIE